MNIAYRLPAALAAGMLALFVLKALGVPFWRGGFDIGDQFDGFCAAAWLVWFLTPARDGRQP